MFQARRANRSDTEREHRGSAGSRRPLGYCAEVWPNPASNRSNPIRVIQAKKSNRKNWIGAIQSEPPNQGNQRTFNLAPESFTLLIEAHIGRHPIRADKQESSCRSHSKQKSPSQNHSVRIVYSEPPNQSNPTRDSNQSHPIKVHRTKGGIDIDKPSHVVIKRRSSPTKHVRLRPPSVKLFRLTVHRKGER